MTDDEPAVSLEELALYKLRRRHRGEYDQILRGMQRNKKSRAEYLERQHAEQAGGE